MRRTILTMATLLLVPALSVAGDDEAPAPTEHHKILAKDVGTWDAEMKVWMAPGADPMTSKAVETNTMLGGIWLVSDFKGDFGGLEFIGHGQFGYDPSKQKFVGTWIDNMNPHMSMMEGTWDEEAQSMTMISKGIEAHSGAEMTGKIISRYEGDDSRTMEMHMEKPGAPGEYIKQMEITYTRKKS